MLPNNFYLVRKIGTNKTPVLPCMRMGQLTPRQTSADVGITPQEWKPDPEVSLKYDDLYTRAWECEYEEPVFDAENNNATPPISTQIPVQSDVSNEKVLNTPGTTHECSTSVSHECWLRRKIYVT